MRKEHGILYVSTGGDYRAETLRSARSAKEHMPSIPIALFTDKPPGDSDRDLFDFIEIIESPRFSFFDKIIPLTKTPFDKTLFVDTDTVFLQPVDELFAVLDQFDLACCHAVWRQSLGMQHLAPDIPDCFVEINTGVLAYRHTDEMMQLIRGWERIYASQLELDTPPKNDQPAFRKALYSSSVKPCVLPPEYNLRTPFPMFKGRGIPPKILHGRGDSLEWALKVIDRGTYMAVYEYREKIATVRNRIAGAG